MALGAGQAVKHGGEDGQISKDRNNDHGHAQWTKSLAFAKTDFTSLYGKDTFYHRDGISRHKVQGNRVNEQVKKS